MVEIRKVTRKDLSVEDIGKLVDLYITSFADRCSGITNMRPFAVEEIDFALDEEGSFTYVGFHDEDPVGLLTGSRVDRLHSGALLYVGILCSHALDLRNNYRAAKTRFEANLAYQKFWIPLFGYLSVCHKVNLTPEEFGEAVNYLPEGFSPLTIFRDAPLDIQVVEADIFKLVTAVDKKYQRNGTATELNRQLIEDAKKEGVAHIFTGCTEDPGIIKMNKDLGYQPFLSIKPYYKDGSSTTFMVKDLTSKE